MVEEGERERNRLEGRQRTQKSGQGRENEGRKEAERRDKKKISEKGK